MYGVMVDVDKSITVLIVVALTIAVVAAWVLWRYR